eukprot:TRINITY_DN1780_c0_g1_i1.p1 TRINITY_DN1780_c0_g1~~TRINITY_DN1780_c0_g1_i1.p1  ORF type:complete len:488 (+),score=132.54 TRINITY_DN1780_c0_g1_i1:102-1565(+)
MAIVLKITLGDDTRRISFERPPSYEELTQIVKQLFKLSIVQLKYEDEDKDKITVTSQIELNEAFFLASRHFNNVLRIFVSETPVTSMEMNFLMKFLTSINLGVPTNAPADVVGSPAVQEVLSHLGLSSSSSSSSSSSIPTSSSNDKSSSSVDEPVPAPVVNQTNSNIVHRGVTCDGCKTVNFTGVRYKCDICRNYDLCENCKAKGDEIHPTTHTMVSITNPVTYMMRRGHHCWRSALPSSDSQPTMKSRPSATFIKHVNYENERALPGSHITKTWRVRNDGSCVWPVGTVLLHVGGYSVIPADKRSVLVPLAAPGEEIDISVELTMPSDGNQFSSFWRLSTADGITFGKRMKACFNIQQPNVVDSELSSSPMPMPSLSGHQSYRPRFKYLCNLPTRQQTISSFLAARNEVLNKEEEEKKAKEEVERRAREEAEEVARKAREEQNNMSAEEASAVQQLSHLGLSGDLLSVLRMNGGDINAAALQLLGQ